MKDLNEYSPEEWAAEQWLRMAAIIRENLESKLPEFAAMNSQDKKDFVATARDALFLELNALTFIEEVEKARRPKNPWDDEPGTPEE